MVIVKIFGKVFTKYISMQFYKNRLYIKRRMIMLSGRMLKILEYLDKHQNTSYKEIAEDLKIKRTLCKI